MNRLFPQLPFPERLALEFLGTFARCEYALKESGYATGGAKEVKADWDTFARKVDARFQRMADKGLWSAMNFLLTEPPRKQVLTNGRVHWTASPPSKKLKKTEQVLLMVRRVRNNLFHGAKVWSPEYSNRARDINLIRASLIVLQHCMQLDEYTNRAYQVGVF